MKLTKKEQETIRFYQEQAQKWAARHDASNKPSFWSEELQQFHTLLPTGRILEIGVGAAREASELIKLGYEYVGIEPATSLTRLAQERFDNATFYTMNVYDIEAKLGMFDGIWCAATLLHVPPDKLGLALQHIKSVLKPGAVGFIMMAALLTLRDIVLTQDDN